MKYISIAGVDRPRASLWASAAQRAGLSLTLAPAPYVLPLSGQGSRDIAAREGVNYFDTAALHTVSSRAALAALGVPVLPTAVPKTPEELLAIEGAVFAKPAITITKATEPLAYKQWASTEHLLAEVGPAFWDGQQSQETAYSVQPLVTCPISEFTAYTSVNEQSQVFIYHSSADTSDIVDRRSLIVQPVPVPAEIQTAVQTVCTALNIKGGIHDVQFIQHKGVWYMNDWNARPGGISEGLVPARGVMESALLHMVGEPVLEVAPFYGEQRGYWGRGIPMEVANTARKMGMFPRCNDGYLSRVYCEGADQASVRERLNLFEESIP